MGLHFKNGDEVSDSIGLLISILLRYPEVGAINFEPNTNLIKFTFIIYSLVPTEELDDFREKLLSCHQTLFFLQNKQAETIVMEYSFCEELTLLEIRRDVKSLSSGEIALIVSLMRDSFPLAADQNDSLKEEDLVDQEELIGRMLDNVRYSLPEKRLIAFREEGKVLVFNK